MFMFFLEFSLACRLVGGEFQWVVRARAPIKDWDRVALTSRLCCNWLTHRPDH